MTHFDPDHLDYSESQVRAFNTCAYFAWQALTEHDPELAQKYFDAISLTQCDSMARLSTHLQNMHQHYENYSMCILQVQLDAQQSQLSHILVNSLPDSARDEVRRSLRSTPAHQHAWPTTWQFPLLSHNASHVLVCGPWPIGTEVPNATKAENGPNPGGSASRKVTIAAASFCDFTPPAVSRPLPPGPSDHLAALSAL